MNDGLNIFAQSVTNNIRTNENKRKIFIGPGDTVGFLANYSYFKEDYRLIAIDISKQQAYDADIKPI